MCATAGHGQISRGEACLCVLGHSEKLHAVVQMGMPGDKRGCHGGGHASANQEVPLGGLYHARSQHVNEDTLAVHGNPCTRHPLHPNLLLRYKVT